MSATGRGGKRDSLDRYYTPPALAAALVAALDICPGARICEPSAGGGAFLDALAQTRPARLLAIDVDPAAPALTRAPTVCVSDFLEMEFPAPFDWIVGNPPYGRALDHVRHALKHADRVAFLLRLAFLESAKRAPFWAAHPCRRVWALSERPSFTGGGTDSAAYGFFYWDQSYPGPTRLDVLSWRAPQGGSNRAPMDDAGDPWRLVCP